MPFSHVLESERERWKPFRRALSKEDQEAFDRPPFLERAFPMALGTLGGAFLIDRHLPFS